jgi:hypothetical protein
MKLKDAKILITGAFPVVEDISLARDRPDQPNKLRSQEIAHAIKAMLKMENRGFIPELTVRATNPWS